ncbi:sensor histidine kinase [Paracandidimonas soli]|uniref:sensor histidine kinase n=1 Tax=Paracandidimonas soli TaxID=1917182 RepID=UPI0033416826
MPAKDKPHANRPQRSLKSLLLLWIIPILLLVSSLGLWSSNTVLKEQVEAAYDRSLAGVLRAIDINISTDSGGLALEQPYRLLEFFDLTASGNVYYRIATEDGLAEIGHGGLPLPSHAMESGKMYFFNARYLDEEPVRAAVLARPLIPPLHTQQGVSQRVVIQVAESLEQRQSFIQGILLRAAGRDVLVIVLNGVLLVCGVIFALRPLLRLRNELAQRSTDDLSPISQKDVPSEVLPLVEAINHHMERYARQAKSQRQFLDDASHQLRTPLTILRTQLDYALRENDLEETRAAIHAMRDGLERATRVTNQMLALARAHGAAQPEAAMARESFSLNRLVEESTRLMLPAAKAKRLDYGMDLPPRQVPFTGMKLLLQEAIVNLIDNAIRYSPEGGSVMVLLSASADEIRITVADDGPGMSPQDMAKAGVRFRRGAAGKSQAGAGLGLAIVKAIAELHMGELRLASPRNRQGLDAELVFSLIRVSASPGDSER